MPNEQAQSSITQTMTVIPKVDTSALKSSVDKIKSAFEGAFSGLGKGRADFFGNISSSVNGATQKLKEFNAPIKELKSSFASFRNEIGNSGAFKAFSKIGNFVTTPMKKMVANFKEGIKHATGFFSAIKRIVIYRAIRFALKAITQGFQEGRQNAYQWSVITGNQFARSMDMMATSALYLKNSLGAMTMPLTNYLAPILDRLIDQFVELINIVNRFIATITGASSWVKALKYPAEYMEQASGSAKELKNQLLGFDDLNILNAPRGSGSASAMDYSNMFQKIELEASKVNFTKSIMEAIKNSDWDKLEELLDEHINGLIERLEPKKFANALGKKLNKAIRLIHTLINAVDFNQIGVKIGEFISNLQLDWSHIGSAWATWKTNMLDLLLGIVDGISWGNVGKAIGDFIRGVFDHFAEWLNGIDWEQKGAELTASLQEAIDALDIPALAQSLFNVIKAVIKATIGLLQGSGIIDMLANSMAVNPLGEVQITPKVSTPTTPSVTGRGANNGSTASNPYNPNRNPQAYSAWASGNYNLAKMLGAKGLANGGFPEQGTYFYAGEAGAEVVAQIGGRTGVYNADQMTGALATANEGVISTLTAVGNAIVGAINRKDMSISTSDMRNAINKMNVRYGV